MRIIPLAIAALLCSATFAAGRARATEDFPRALAREVGAPFESPCSLCHLGDLRTNDSVNTLFGRAMRARGLAAEDEASLQHAVVAMRDENVDSDRDGVGDIDELELGSDPNLPGDQKPGDPIAYGCGAQVVGRQPFLGMFGAFGGLAVMLVLGRPRRSLSRPR